MLTGGDVGLLQLTLIELDFVRAIDTHELVVYMWNRTPANEPYWNNLKLLIERFNKVCCHC